MDVSQITAGEYELVAELFDQRTSPPDKPFDFKRYRRGDTITLDVEEARRLYAGGAILPPGEAAKQAVAAAQAQLQAALAAVPPELRDQLAAEPPAPQPSVPPGEDQPAEQRQVTGPAKTARR